MATYGQLGASVGAAVLLLWPFLCVFGPPSLLQHYLLPPAVVIGALLLDAASFRITNRHILTFGAASYALYLIHPLVIETLRPVAVVLPFVTLTTISGVVVTLVVSYALALFFHYRFELPVGRRLHSLGTNESRSTGHGVVPGR